MERRKTSGALEPINPRRTIQAASPCSAGSAGRKQPTQLTIPLGQPSTEKISVLVREWLVPMLVRKFLSEHPSAQDSAYRRGCIAQECRITSLDAVAQKDYSSSMYPRFRAIVTAWVRSFAPSFRRMF
jgi:hypothetical protein